MVDRYSAKARWASCSVADRWFSTWQLYIQFAYPIFLYIPAIGVILISFAITVKLFTHKKPGDKTASPSAPPRHMRSRKDKQIVIQLMLIVGSFLLGYTPVTGEIPLDTCVLGIFRSPWFSCNATPAPYTAA